MDSIVSLPARIVSWLSSQSDMSDLSFFAEYPPVKKAVPLRNTIVAVGIENIEITDKFTENDDGVLERQEYCRLAEIKTNLSICVPFDLGGQACHDVFTRIADAMTFRTNLNIVKSGCSEITPDRDTDALVMTGWFLMNADFCPALSTDENFASFLDKDLICGSHVRNEDIHVTAEDKARWNKDYQIGFYFGNGSGTRTISTDFKPGFVLVAASDAPPVSIDFSDSTAKSYWGFASADSGSQAIEITANGFRVKSTSSGDVSSALNEATTTYTFIAFREATE